MNSPIVRLGTSTTAASAAVVFVLVLTSASIVCAQGNGQGHGYGLYKPKGNSTSGPSAAGSPDLQVSGTGVRTFGSWLDDASMLAPGQGSLTLSFAYWRTPGYREFDAPVIDTGIGLTRRVQLNASVPYYHANEPGGPVTRGLGDFYLSTKIQLRDPAARGHRVGFSITPLVEVRSYAAPDSSRASWALPGSIELQRPRWRAFGSAGYFSRGALFASGAVQASLSDRVAVVGTITRSHSVRRDDLSVALGLAQSRTDVSGSVGIGVTPAASVFVAMGRTISRRDANSSTFSVAGGVAFSFGAWR
jgi:hypothetical protein